MVAHVGTLLWELRTARGLSIGQLARIAGVSKGALSQWETGKRQPRVAELEAALDALQAGGGQRARAFAQIEAPRAVRYLKQSAPREGLPPPPTAGDLLRAMRLRKSWSQEQVGDGLGVARHTVARWELGERLPSPEQMQALCYLLEAQEEELVALTTGAFGETPQRIPDNWEEARPHLRKAAGFILFTPGLQDLRFFALEREVWDWATREEEAKRDLGRIYAFHATVASHQARWQEAAALAQKAVGLLADRPDTDDYLRARLIQASADVYGGYQILPQRGMHLLASLTTWNGSPEYRAWLLADLAKYASLAGQTETSLDLVEQARQLAKRCENRTEFYLRRLDNAQLLLAAGRPAEALNMAPDPAEATWDQQAKVLLVLAEAHIQIGNLSEGQNWLQQAHDMIETHQITLLRAKVDELTRNY